MYLLIPDTSKDTAGRSAVVVDKDGRTWFYQRKKCRPRATDRRTAVRTSYSAINSQLSKVGCLIALTTTNFIYCCRQFVGCVLQQFPRTSTNGTQRYPASSTPRSVPVHTRIDYGRLLHAPSSTSFMVSIDEYNYSTTTARITLEVEKKNLGSDFAPVVSFLLLLLKVVLDTPCLT